MSAEALLAFARTTLGWSGRPNPITREYAARHGNVFLEASWCDMGVTYWGRHSGTAAAVLPGGDRAYTVWHAQDFQKQGRWHPGTIAEVNKAKPGDVVFFDWGDTDNIGAIDHVGLVEKNLGNGTLQTIEANTGNAVKRRIRYAIDTAGYGRPDFGQAAAEKAAGGAEMLGLKRGDEGPEVEYLQEMLRNSGPKYRKLIDDAGGTDGKYGAGTAKAFRLLRIDAGSDHAKDHADGGDKVDAWGLQQLMAMHTMYWAAKAK